jgi:hypothetical protein
VGEPTDEAVARQALARQRGEFGETASYRDMEVAGVFSRGTLARWAAGDYTMKPASKRKILDWLGAAPVRESPSYAEGIRFAVDRVQRSLDELRALLPSPDEASGTPAASDARHFFEAGGKKLKEQESEPQEDQPTETAPRRKGRRA